MGCSEEYFPVPTHEKGENEMTPMISPLRHDSNGAIDIPPSPHERQEFGPRRGWFTSKFNHIYAILFVLSLIMLSILVIVIVIAVRLSAVESSFDDAKESLRVDNVAQAVKSELAGMFSSWSGASPIGSSASSQNSAGHKSDSNLNDDSNNFIDPVKAEVHYPDDTRRAPTAYPWRDVECKRLGKCPRNDFSSPPLVILSVDGFQRAYLDRKLVKTFEYMAECGVTAERVIPSFPSRTFPNHYTMVTGLYPESHGIVDNYVYDPSISPVMEDMKKTKFDAFWGGDPIWSVYKRQTGKRAYSMFYPGSAYNTTGYKPDVSPPYNQSVSFRDRIDQIVGWLKLPEDERPGVITAYFDQPDTVGHAHKTDEEVSKQLLDLDKDLDYLLTSLYKEGLLECINLFIVSDHGMQDLKITKQFQDDVDMKAGDVLGAIGVVGRLQLVNESEYDAKIDRILKPFSCQHGTVFKTYTRNSIPTRKHYSKTTRVGDVILQGQPGTTFVTSPDDDWHLSADHGYDNHVETMHTMFFARGPSLKPNVLLPAFQNIEYFNVFLDLLGLDHVPNNGTEGLLDEMFVRKKVKKFQTESFAEISGLFNAKSTPECTSTFQPASAYSCSGECSSQEIRNLSDKLFECSLLPMINVPLVVQNSCVQRYCNVDVIDNNGSTVVVERLVPEDVDGPIGNCTFGNARYSNSCPTEPQNNQTLVRRSMLSNQNSAMSSIAAIQEYWETGFVSTVLDPLDRLTSMYKKRYQRMTVISGVAYDWNYDGVADDQKNSNASHFYRILIVCDGAWKFDGSSCANSKETNVLSFVFPILKSDINCLGASDLLLDYTARIRDVELISGIEFNIAGSTSSEINRLRTFINMKLW